MCVLARPHDKDLCGRLVALMCILSRFLRRPVSPPKRPDLEPAPITPPEPVTAPEPREMEPIAMKTSIRGLLEIMSHEALVVRRYLDDHGVWTLAVGITDKAGLRIKPSQFTGVITVEEAVEMFQAAIPQYEKFVDRALNGRRVSQHEYDALVSLAFNAGNIAKPQTMAKLAAGDVAGAINVWRANRNLWGRRAKEAALASTGQYKAKYLNIYDATPDGRVIWKRGKRVPLSEISLNGGGSW